ncbi:MAG: rhodanese-like domain-containing protein [Nodosilinea sp.]
MDNTTENIKNTADGGESNPENVAGSVAKSTENVANSATNRMENVADSVAVNVRSAADDTANTLENVSRKVADDVETTKSAVTAPLPTPPDLQAQAAPEDLQKRLSWGEPALTILDVRERAAFNQERIMGAVPMPMADLVSIAQEQLEINRDIYIYGEDEASTAQAAQQLRAAGFQSVAEIRGGLSGWKATNGRVEGTKA